MKKLIGVLMLAGLIVGCATSKPSYVNPGMSREDVIRRLGPPITVVARDETGVEFFHYRVPALEVMGEQEELVDLVVPIYDGTVLSPDDLIVSD